MPKTIKLRLVLDVDYDASTITTHEAMRILESLPDLAAGEGGTCSVAPTTATTPSP